jgi:peroxiredoxin
VNVTAPDSPPPGAGLKTVTFAVPAVATSLAGIVAVSTVLETKVVVRGLPFQRTTELVTKFVPVMVRVNPPLPATVVDGLIVVIVGDGFVMVKVAVSGAPPPGAGLKTVTFAVPAVATSLAGMIAVSTVLETNPVVRSFPFQRTTELVTKFVPVMMRVNPPLPATVVDGLIVVIVGDGFVMVKVAVLDVR